MHTENLNKNKVRFVSVVSFILGFLDAFFIYVLSTYFSTISGSDNVGIFYLVGFSGVLLSLFFLRRWIRFMGKSRVLYLSLGVSILACALLIGMAPSWLSALIIFSLIIATNITWVALDILLESYSKDHVSGRIRGLYLTIINAGILIAPLLSLRTLDRFQYEGIFFILIIGYSVVFLISLLAFREDNKVTLEKLRFGATISKMFREKNLLYIYHISFAMEFFYALMIVYTPLHLRSLGFSWDEIGIIFTAMLLPFVFLQYPLGVLADRYLGEKELLISSIAIAMSATAFLPFLSSANMWAWGLFLFFTRVGIAGIEILRDSYFYKQIDGNDMDVIAFFRTTRPVANIAGAVISTFVLLFLPIQSIFFVVAGVLFVAMLNAFLLEDTRGEEEKKEAFSV